MFLCLLCFFGKKTRFLAKKRRFFLALASLHVQVSCGTSFHGGHKALHGYLLVKRTNSIISNVPQERLGLIALI